VLPLRGLPFGIALHRRRIGDPELAREVVHHLRRDVQRVGQEHADKANRPELQAEAKPVVITTPLRDQRRSASSRKKNSSSSALRRADEPAIRGNLIIAEKLHRHRT
jgi:hypothetical protein